jgi:hypothetical protein
MQEHNVNALRSRAGAFFVVLSALLSIFALSGCDNGTTTETVYGETVYGDTLDHITVGGPAKTSYANGTAFSTAGLVIVGYYKDGSTVNVSSGYTLTWNGQSIAHGNTAITLTDGTKTVTASWWGKTADFTIGVNTPAPLNVADLTTWNDAINTIKTGPNNAEYIINISGIVGVPGVSAVTFGTKTGISVQLRGSGKLFLTSQGRLIQVGANQTVIIGEEGGAGPALEGLKAGQNGMSLDNNQPVIYVYGSNALLQLKSGTISGNTASGFGGGVRTDNSGTFTMSGGTISGNTASGLGGGGVHAYSGAFTKAGGGIIYGNDAAAELKNTASGSNGHAVYGPSGKKRNTTLDADDNISTTDTTTNWE